MAPVSSCSYDWGVCVSLSWYLIGLFYLLIHLDRQFCDGAIFLVQDSSLFSSLFVFFAAVDCPKFGTCAAGESFLKMVEIHVINHGGFLLFIVYLSWFLKLSLFFGITISSYVLYWWYEPELDGRFKLLLYFDLLLGSTHYCGVFFFNLLVLLVFVFLMSREAVFGTMIDDGSYLTFV